MLFKLSNLNLNLALTLGYLNPALKNPAQINFYLKVNYNLENCIFSFSVFSQGHQGQAIDLEAMRARE